MEEQRLWQAVIEQAIADANYKGDNQDALREKPVANRWIRKNTDEFRNACYLAGMDPDFVRDAYMAGKWADYVKVNREKQNETV